MMNTKEIKITAYEIEGSNATILCKMASGDYAVKTPDGIFCYSAYEVLEIYGVQPNGLFD